MQQNCGILFLADPLRGVAHTYWRDSPLVSTLIFHENERYLSQAQAALWELRKRCGWVCVAAAGSSASIAVALGAQLPVDRLALMGSCLFDVKKQELPRQLARLRRFARHNLSLVVSEIVLIGASASEISGFVPSLHRRLLCALDSLSDPLELAAPWDALNEKNLLNPGKCV